MKTSNYVKCLVKPFEDLTIGKVYGLLDADQITDDVGCLITIVMENEGFFCAFLDNDNWKFCDKDGNLIN